MATLNVGSIAVQALVVSIDPTVWTQAHTIEWPGQDRTVTVLELNRPEQTIPCAEIRRLQAAKDSRESYSFRVGESCQKLFVVMDLSGGINGGTESLKLLAHHESFHIAAQMYGAKIPVEYLEIDPALTREFSRGDEFTEFYEDVEELTASILSGTPSSCNKLESSYELLDARPREYLDYKIFWEWPAEFYAQQAVIPDDFERYQLIRSKLFAGGDPGYRLFLSGVRVGLALDTIAGRENWQSAVAEGHSMLNLLLSHSGCRARQPSPTVRMKHVEL